MSHNHILKEATIEEFFSSVSPSQVRKSLLEVFMHYLIRMDTRNIPKDITMISQDIFLLMQFLEQLEEERKKKYKEEGVR